MITETLQHLITSNYSSATTEDDFLKLKEDLKSIRKLTNHYEYQLVNLKLKEFMYPKSQDWLKQLQEAFPKIDWEITKGDIFITFETKYITSDQLTIEFKASSSPFLVWYVDAPFIHDLEFEGRHTFSTLEEAIEYLKAALLKVKQSIEKFI